MLNFIKHSRFLKIFFAKYCVSRFGLKKFAEIEENKNIFEATRLLYNVHWFYPLSFILIVLFQLYFLLPVSFFFFILFHNIPCYLFNIPNGILSLATKCPFVRYGGMRGRRGRTESEVELGRDSNMYSVALILYRSKFVLF